MSFILLTTLSISFVSITTAVTYWRFMMNRSKEKELLNWFGNYAIVGVIDCLGYIGIFFSLLPNVDPTNFFEATILVIAPFSTFVVSLMIMLMIRASLDHNNSWWKKIVEALENDAE